MPETPMPGVNGHVVSSPALHASSSMLSFAPAARTSGCAASIARAGSFCLFCENGVALLPVVTSVSGSNASANGTSTSAATIAPSTTGPAGILLISCPLLQLRLRRRDYDQEGLVTAEAVGG